MANTSNYCALPFRGMQIWTDGSLKPCCMYNQDLHVGKIYNINEYNEWWQTGLEDLRNDFKNNHPPKSCSLCFHEKFQNSGVRVSGNNWMVKQIPDYTVSEFPENIDITFGNICNLKCIMCSSQSSSRIETEYKQNQVKFNAIGIVQANMPKLQKWWEDPQQLEKMKKILSQARYINFSGGEPLMIPTLINLLKMIPRSCFVEINTNLTHLTDEHIQHFKTIRGRISISLDGIGPHHEYIRYESSWPTIENNINKLLELKNPEFAIAFSYILQHTSVYTFPNFWNYFKKLPNKIRISEVIPNTHIDNMMTINTVIPEDVQHLKSWLINNQTSYDDILNNWINNYEFDQIAHDHFKNYIDLVDEIRGCNFRKTFQPCW